jgi:hypothetical protein
MRSFDEKLLRLLVRLTNKLLARGGSAKLEDAFVSPLDVRHAYRLFLDQEPDREGWKFWLSLIGARPTAVNTLSSFFISNTEFAKRIAARPCPDRNRPVQDLRRSRRCLGR